MSTFQHPEEQQASPEPSYPLREEHSRSVRPAKDNKEMQTRAHTCELC